MESFADKVRSVVRRIPSGEVMTYKEVSVKVGNPNAARAVANVMAKNFDLEIPCHRVIKSDHTLGGYNRGGERVKKKLLLSEGVILST